MDDLNDASTSILLERIRENDARALEVLLERILPRIRQEVHDRRPAMFGARFDTQDLSQDVAVDLIHYLPRIRCAKSEVLDAILRRVIRRTLNDTSKYLMALRRQVTRDRPLPGDTVLDLQSTGKRAESPSELAMRREQDAWVRLALPLLDPEDEELILRARLNGESYAEIARQRGEHADAVRMRCNRAVSRLTNLVGLLRRGRLEEALESAGP